MAKFANEAVGYFLCSCTVVIVVIVVIVQS
jgi:hypothetical protein